MSQAQLYVWKVSLLVKIFTMGEILWQTLQPCLGMRIYLKSLSKEKLSVHLFLTYLSYFHCQNGCWWAKKSSAYLPLFPFYILHILQKTKGKRFSFTVNFMVKNLHHSDSGAPTIFFWPFTQVANIPQMFHSEASVLSYSNLW